MPPGPCWTTADRQILFCRCAEDAEKQLAECRGGLEIHVPDAFKEAEKKTAAEL
ncbi:MAG: hypothetical protein R2941_06480 [Desulfobacterales bacterium]